MNSKTPIKLEAFKAAEGGPADAAEAGRAELDLLEGLRRQRGSGGRVQRDLDFGDFVSGVTIVDQLIEREFKRYVTANFGLSPGDVRILLVLRRSGSDPGLRPTDLFKRLLVTSGAITKQLDRLEGRGLIKRVFNADNKRGWLVVLTDAGRELTEHGLGGGASMPTARAVFDALSDADRAEFLRLLHLIVGEIKDRTQLNPID